MRVRFIKNIMVDEKQFYKNDTAWLKCIERYTEKNDGDYMYLIIHENIIYSVNKKYLDFD